MALKAFNSFTVEYSIPSYYFFVGYDSSLLNEIQVSYVTLFNQITSDCVTHNVFQGYIQSLAGLLSGFGGGGSFTTNVQVLSTSGTYTPSTNLAFATVEIWGGGGGGGSSYNQSGSNWSTADGGAAGGYAKKTFTALQINALPNLGISIGSGGNAGAANGNVGITGGTSTFSNILSATGGSGGYISVATALFANSNSNDTVGGVGLGGSYNGGGEKGGRGFTNYPLSEVCAGTGGSSLVGRGGPGGNAAAGQAAIGFAAGGGGSSSSATPNLQGGAGSQGLVIITEYISIAGSGGGGSYAGTTNVKVLTSSGTYTPSSNLLWSVVECVGGGGGGSGSINCTSTQVSCGVGGGGGGYVKKTLTAAQLTGTLSFVVGSGGTAGSPGGSGGYGGSSTFTYGTSPTTITGGGGGGTNNGIACAYVAVGNSTAYGGTATGGDVNFAGGPSCAGSGTTYAAITCGGNGGNSGNGSGGSNASYTSSSQIGNTPNGFGGGGSGGATSQSNSGASGGAGAPGVVIITEYIV